MGRGRYVDDLAPRHAALAAFVRSPHPHARIHAVRCDVARAMPGVVCVLTGDDWLADGRGAFVVASPVESTDGIARPQFTQPVLAHDRVSYVGQPTALVVADTLMQALDAAEAVEIDYEPLPAVTDPALALSSDAPVIHAGAENNLIFLREIGDAKAVEEAFAAASHVTSLALTNSRITANPMEPRAALGEYSPGTDQFTLWATHQAPHILRRDLAENTLRHPEHRIRVVAPDVGGGFGMKVANHPEDAAILWAAKMAGRPVRWAATRSESLLSDAQARDHWTQARMAFDRDGRITAIHVDTLASLGAFQTRLGASIPAQYYARFLTGLYRIPAAYCRVRAVHTNAAPVQAYRGAGRPEASYVVESLVENGAREMGIDPCTLRTRNFIAAQEFPYSTPLGLRYDAAHPAGLQEKAIALFDYAGQRREQEAATATCGEIIGIGASAFVDCAGTPSSEMLKMGRKKVGGWDSATIRIHPSGKVTILAGSHSHGQGHATTFAQIAAESLQCPLDDIEVVYGDTEQVQFGHGTWGSRSTVTTGMAVAKAAAQLAAKCRRIAAHLMECHEADVVLADGVLRIGGSDCQLPFQDIVDAAYQGGGLPDGLDPALEQIAFYDPVERNYSSGYHLCAVGIDPETWRVRILRYTAIDDCGRIINPMIVEGQAHGGIAQGIGQALMEHIAFDPMTGQPLCGSFMDYAMPRASDFPSFLTGVQETPATSNDLGVRPAGESGTIGALAAVRNAVVDALWSRGVRHIDMPMTPARIWAAVQTASAQKPT